MNFKRGNIMKLMRIAIILITVLFFANNLSAAEQLLTIVHTNDMHSHVQGFSPEIDYRPFTIDADKTLGGWSRLATVIKNIKKERLHPVLVVDAGDYTMDLSSTCSIGKKLMNCVCFPRWVMMLSHLAIMNLI